MDDRKICPLVVVAGPTASGKTALGIALAKRFHGEIVSADSMQIYKGMDIATAKPSLDERDGIPHHMMDFLEPDESFSVSDYVTLANQAIDGIYARDHLPIVVGGTGLYIRSLINNIQFTEEKRDPDYRRQLEREAKEKGGAVLLCQLSEIDPAYATTLHPNNLTRIIRGLEIYHNTGICMSEHLQRSRQVPSRFHVCMLGLNYRNRDLLYDRIDLRVDFMLEQGLLEEAREVLSRKNLKTAYQAIGYKELKKYFDGQESLEDALANIKQQSRRYAKRQLTWFRREEQIHWLYPDDPNRIQTIYEQSCEIIEKELGL